MLLICYAIKSDAQANKTLSNLTSPTAVNQSLLPGTNNTINLGSSSLRWKNLNLGNALYLKGNITIHAPGTESFFAGSNAGNTSVTGDNNTGVGQYALYRLTSGTGNTGSGSYSLYYNTTGYRNTATGNSSLLGNTSGNYNTAIGNESMWSNTIGSYNTAIGLRALANNNGNYNTALGTYAGTSADNLTNATAIGYLALVDASNKIRIGNTSVTSIGGHVGWSTFSDGRYKRDIKENVQGLAFINSLRPITYTVNLQGLNEYYNKGRKQVSNEALADNEDKAANAEMKKAEEAAGKIVYNGFIAQEVEEAAKKLNFEFSGVDKPQSKDGLYGLRYDNFIVPLVKAVQELSQMNDEKDARINTLEIQNQELKSRLEKMEAMIFSKQSQPQNIELTVAPGLEQNIPNPFTNITTIGYYLPKNISNAYINFYSSYGALLKSVKLSGSGKATINLKANELPSGVFQYGLVIDGKVVDSKQMVQTK